MDLKKTVSEIMTEHVVTLSPKDTMTDVKSIYDNQDIHHLPVVDKGKLVGMISKTDLTFFLKGFSRNTYDQMMDDIRLKSHLVEDVMTTKLAKLEPTDKIEVAVEVFKENFCHALPVVEDDYLVGIVSVIDILRYIS